jgi:glycosyltransferase involved in cell wall biosynthesis
VAYDYAAAAQHVRHGTSGLLAAYGETVDFTARAGEMLAWHQQDPEKFKAMGRDARLTAEALDWDCVVQELETLLFSLA